MSDEPTFDGAGYPTEETLGRIMTWPVGTIAGMHAAMDFAGRAWRWPDYWQRIEGPDPERPDRQIVRYVFSTGGWSGNEDIVAAIETNRLLQFFGAWSWRRGGHYEYRFPVSDGENKHELGLKPYFSWSSWCVQPEFSGPPSRARHDFCARNQDPQTGETEGSSVLPSRG